MFSFRSVELYPELFKHFVAQMPANQIGEVLTDLQESVHNLQKHYVFQHEPAQKGTQTAVLRAHKKLREAMDAMALADAAIKREQGNT